MSTFRCKSLVIGLVLLVTTAVLAVPTMARPGETGAPCSAAASGQEASTSALIYTEQKVTAPDGAAYYRFGYSLALEGNTALVGAPGTLGGPFGPPTGPGVVYVFSRSGTTWSFQQQLTAPDGDLLDHFGSSVALDGDTAVVGARYDDIGEDADQGSVYVFTRSGETWSFQQKGWDPAGEASDSFGTSVALDEDTVVVGARYGGTVDQGAVYVFTRSGTVWSFQQKGWDPAGEAYDSFGAAVALDGDTVVVGAPQGGPVDQGAVYVFTRSGTTWSLQQQGWDPAGAAGDSFGASVALDGDTVIVGAPDDDIGEEVRQGAVYVFTRSGTIWSLQQKGWDPAGEAYEQFGSSVALNGDTALVGVPGTDWYEYPAIPGSAYVFARSGTVWSLEQQLTAADGALRDLFGAAVALDRETALLGAPGDTVSEDVNQGAAYIYEFDAAPYVVAITRAGASLTSAGSVDFDVLFSEAVTGVADEDFALSTTGTLSSARVSDLSGSGASYVVTVGTGTGEGTLRLDVPASATITDLAGQALSDLPYTDGESYTIEREPDLYLPLVVSSGG